MEITIKGKKLELCSPLSGRTNIMYEDIMGESVDFTKLKTTSSIAKLLYANVLATLEKNHMPLDIEYTTDFKDILDDDNGGMNFLLEYIQWIAKLLGVQDVLSEVSEDKEENKKETIKKK